MNFKELYNTKVKERNNNYLRFLKYHQAMIYINRNNVHILHRVSAGYIKHPISLPIRNKTLIKNLLDLSDLDLIKINVIRDRAIELRPTDVGQKLVQNRTHESIPHVKRDLRHKDKWHRILQNIAKIILIINVIDFIYLVMLLNDTLSQTNLIGIVICILGASLLLLGLIGSWIYHNNYKYSFDISIQQLREIYKKYQNKADYHYSIKVIQNKYLDDELKKHNPNIHNNITKQCFE